MPYSALLKPLHTASQNVPFAKKWKQAYPDRSAGMAAAPVGSGVKTFNNPSVHAFPRVGVAVLNHYRDDFYYRIHILPRLIDLGSVGSDQEQEFKVWNAFFTDKNFVEVSGQSADVIVEGPRDAPYVWKALLQETWTLKVSGDGPSTVVSTLSWVYGDTTAGLPVSGVRVVAWTLRMNWDAPFTERMEWLTSVTTADKTAREQRRRLRLSPRVTLGMQSIAQYQQRRYIELLLASAGGRKFAQPFWPHSQVITTPISIGAMSVGINTFGLNYYPGGMLILHGEDPWLNEVCEVSEVFPGSVSLTRPVLKNWPALTRVSPGRLVYFVEQPQIRRLTDEHSTVTVSAQQADLAEWPALDEPQMFRGRVVLTMRPEESEDLTYSYFRLLRMSDNSTDLPVITDVNQWSSSVQGFKWQLKGRASQSYFKSLAFHLSGRWKSVWVPTFFQDLYLLSDILEGGMQAEFAWSWYTDTKGYEIVGKKDLAIQTKSGQVFCVRIASSVVVEEGQVERLVFADPAEFSVTADQVVRVSFMSTMRLDQEFIDMQYDTDSDGVASARAVFISSKDDP